MTGRGDPSSRGDDLPDGIGNPARNALAHAGVRTLDALTRWSAAEVLALHGVGPKAVRILEAALTERGRSFRQD